MQRDLVLVPEALNCTRRLVLLHLCVRAYYARWLARRLYMYLYLDTRQAPSQSQATQQPVEKRQRRRKQQAPSAGSARWRG